MVRRHFLAPRRCSLTALATIGLAALLAPGIGPAEAIGPPAAAERPGNLRVGPAVLVSTTTSGAPVVAEPIGAPLSGHGRLIAFAGGASFVPPRPSGVQNVLVKNVATGVLRLVSLGPDGTGAMLGFAEAQRISHDGSKIAFFSDISMSPVWTPPFGHVYVRNLHSKVTRRITRNFRGEPIEDGGYVIDFSGDGWHVLFSSSASDLLPRALPRAGVRLYLRDLRTGRTELVVDNPVRTVVQGHGISQDGRYVMFSSNANDLVPDDRNGLFDTFVLDRRLGAMRMITRGLPPAEHQYAMSLAPDGSRASVWSGWELLALDLRTEPPSSRRLLRWPGDRPDPARFSADGRLAVLRTPQGECVVVDLTTGQRRALVGGGGGAGADVVQCRVPEISADGRFATFVAARKDVLPGESSPARGVFRVALRTG